VLIGMAVGVGHHQPDSPWLAELRLTECELPCWNGITPGQTTMADARQRVEATYSDASVYLVEGVADVRNIFAIQVTNKEMGYVLVLNWIIGPSSPSLQDPVQIITLLLFIEARSNLGPALIPDLYRLVGDVEGVAIPQRGGGLVGELLYKAYQVGMTVPFRSCGKVLVEQEIVQINLYDSASLADRQRISGEILPWRGFGRCYGQS
jgi:hypothetical protein